MTTETPAADIVERWPGYDEQSWRQRFVVLERQYDQLTQKTLRLAQVRHDEQLAHANEITRLRARLEVAPGWSEDADGIACRDDTIKLQDARIATLRRKLREAVRALRPFAAHVDKRGEVITLHWGDSTYTGTLKPEHFYAASDALASIRGEG